MIIDSDKGRYGLIDTIDNKWEGQSLSSFTGL